MSVLDSLLARVSVDDNALTGVDEAALQAELEARVALRKKRMPRPPEKNPRSRFAGAEPESAAKRKQMAERRRRKVHAVRDKRENARKQAEEEAFRRVTEQARRSAPGQSRRSTSSSSTSSRSTSSRSSRGFPGVKRDDEIARAYKTLDLPVGADFTEVKSAFRKLMRRYHPDLHNQSPKKQKAATELSMKVTHAYQTLEDHLKG